MGLFTPLFEALNAADARYVVVGGFAVVLHGHTRLTLDVDLVVDLDPEPAREIVDALTELGFIPRAPVKARDFANVSIREAWVEEKGMQVFTMVDRAKTRAWWSTFSCGAPLISMPFGVGPRRSSWKACRCTSRLSKT